MQQVAQNQDRLQHERTSFVYDQHVRVTSRRGSKIVADQETNYTIAPLARNEQRTLVSIKLKYLQKGHLVEVNKDLSADGESLDTGMVKSFRDDLVEGNSKDGIQQDLFPLTSDEQKDLEFELRGERVVNGRAAYIIEFRPKDHHDFGWAGEALIDKEEFEPVTVYTRMSRKLPFFVRTMLGTDVPGLGFTTQYTRVDKNVWFPASFGTEFKVHVLYFFHRTVSMSLQNDHFRHTAVDSDIQYDAAHLNAK